MSSDQAVEATLREFVSRNFYVPDGQVLGRDESLLDQGIVDSTGILEVVLFLEESYGIEVDDDEIIPENLETLAALAAFVERKRTA